MAARDVMREVSYPRKSKGQESQQWTLKETRNHFWVGYDDCEGNAVVSDAASVVIGVRTNSKSRSDVAANLNRRCRVIDLGRWLVVSGVGKNYRSWKAAFAAPPVWASA